MKAILTNNEHYLLTSSENKVWKKFRHLQDWTYDLWNTGVVLYHLS